MRALIQSGDIKQSFSGWHDEGEKTWFDYYPRTTDDCNVIKGEFAKGDDVDISISNLHQNRTESSYSSMISLKSEKLVLVKTLPAVSSWLLIIGSSDLNMKSARSMQRIPLYIVLAVAPILSAYS